MSTYINRSKSRADASFVRWPASSPLLTRSSTLPDVRLRIVRLDPEMDAHQVRKSISYDGPANKSANVGGELIRTRQKHSPAFDYLNRMLPGRTASRAEGRTPCGGGGADSAIGSAKIAMVGYLLYVNSQELDEEMDVDVTTVNNVAQLAMQAELTTEEIGLLTKCVGDYSYDEFNYSREFLIRWSGAHQLPDRIRRQRADCNHRCPRASRSEASPRPSAHGSSGS